ncbi:hypothetical protein BGW36DRAFT_427962 [Talaromyces proteolyticus]|uniref:Uncharacterized protein n=1 Tax=Talaromyces proteolyticus TaxID=1131652 RepID=A0AAD4KNT5_9EURO|nr:uncharacterized protein BGW36DRAFT_427962 [Talaromyces proteolyticus]KAH8695926.1 hypothetical protein BGW36DRAFT_427962 [Talaromyces proteolyticus]
MSSWWGEFNNSHALWIGVVALAVWAGVKTWTDFWGPFVAYYLVPLMRRSSRLPPDPERGIPLQPNPPSIDNGGHGGQNPQGSQDGDEGNLPGGSVPGP